MESDTVPLNGASSIRLQPSFKLKKGWNNRAKAWPAGVGDFLQFVVAKENCDTVSAVGQISKYMRCGPDGIKYAGTKDKRGVTYQFMTMHRRKPSDVTFLNKYVYPPLIRVGNFEYGNTPSTTKMSHSFE